MGESHGAKLTRHYTVRGEGEGDPPALPMRVRPPPRRRLFAAGLVSVSAALLVLLSLYQLQFDGFCSAGYAPAGQAALASNDTNDDTKEP